MADRSIVVRLRAEVDGFKSAMAEATKAAERVGKGTEDAAKKADTGLGRMVQSAQKNRAAWDQVGGTLTAFGAASVGALGLATKAAMDWESSWAGVQKTVDGTAPQMAALEDGLRGLARELPVTHAEIAGVAEAAGQLGIETPNIIDFTRTMVNMGVATNLSSEEAATGLARFMNVMGTSQTDVGKLGAAIVGLGNNYATTEAEILSMSQRLSGAGAQANMSEGDILGMATAMSSVGIEAEAGGSAMSQTMKRIGKAVDEGGASLDLFAQVSGVTSEQFVKAWQDDPAMALDGFINGLSGVEEQGMTTNGVLAELGITGIRESDSLLRLSAAAGQGADGMSLLASAVQTGNAEFDKGSALIEEASKRYETAESRIQLAKNALVDAGISIGGIVLPAFAELADGVADVAGWFADLPGPVLAVVGALGGLAGAGSLAAGAFLLIFPRVMDTVSAFKTLKTDMPGVASGIGKVGKAVGIATAAFAGVSLIAAYGDSLTDFSLGANEAADAAMRLADSSGSGGGFATVFKDMGVDADFASASTKDLNTNLDILANGHWYEGISNLETDMRNAFGAGLATTDDLKARLDEVGQSIAAMATEDLPGAQAAFTALWEEAGGTDQAGQNLLKLMPALRDELIGLATAAEMPTDDMTLLKIATGELTPVIDEATGKMSMAEGAAAGLEEGLDGAASAAEEAATATEDYRQSLLELSNEFITAERAAMDYKDSLKEAGEAVDENGKHWEDGTKAADANKEALLDLADQALATADSLAAEGKSGTFLEKARDDLIEVATEMTGSKELAEEYVDQLLGTPEEIETLVKLETEEAKADWAALWDEVGFNPPEVPISADTAPAEGEWETFTGILGETPPQVPIDANTNPAQEEVTIWGSQVGDVYTDPVKIWADAGYADDKLNQLMAAINDAGGTVTINGQSMPASQALDAIMGTIDASDGTVTINGNKYPADDALREAILAIDSSDGTITIEGDNANANAATDRAVGKANSSSGTIDVDANTAGANSAINIAARTRTAYINVYTRNIGSSLASGLKRAGYATGGAVHGPGTWTSDSVPALLSNGEHVITATEVARAGGQDAIYRMRAAINSGLKFANGGGVENGSYARSPVIRNEVMRPSSSDGLGVAQAVSAAMSGWQPIVNIDGREFAGLMMQGNRRIKSGGGR